MRFESSFLSDIFLMEGVLCVATGPVVILNYADFNFNSNKGILVRSIASSLNVPGGLC
jgi:hypothetical protein